MHYPQSAGRPSAPEGPGSIARGGTPPLDAKRSSPNARPGWGEGPPPPPGRESVRRVVDQGQSTAPGYEPVPHPGHGGLPLRMWVTHRAECGNALPKTSTRPWAFARSDRSCGISRSRPGTVAILLLASLGSARMSRPAPVRPRPSSCGPAAVPFDETNPARPLSGAPP